MGLPEININFTQKAVSAIDRSARGIVVVVVRDDTGKAPLCASYRYETDIETSAYTSDNLTAIKRAFLIAPTKVYVIKVKAAAEFSEVTAELEKLKYNYVCCATSTVTDQQALATYIKAKNANSLSKKYVAVVHNATTTDSKYVINCLNPSVHEKGNPTAVPMAMYLPRLTSIFAALPLNRSSTYYELDELESVTDPTYESEENINTFIDKGGLMLFNDDGVVRIARGVNSLKTISSTESEEMKKIIIVDAMNLIIEDIAAEFKKNYVGKYKNSYDNQALFISSINSYFRGLAKEEVLNPDFNNEAFVDVPAQREAWESIGTDTSGWTDFKVKKMTFRSNLYFAANIKILDAIEDFTFNITMA